MDVLAAQVKAIDDGSQKFIAGVNTKLFDGNKVVDVRKPLVKLVHRVLQRSLNRAIVVQHDPSAPRFVEDGVQSPGQHYLVKSMLSDRKVEHSVLIDPIRDVQDDIVW